LLGLGMSDPPLTSFWTVAIEPETFEICRRAGADLLRTRLSQLYAGGVELDRAVARARQQPGQGRAEARLKVLALSTESAHMEAIPSTLMQVWRGCRPNVDQVLLCPVKLLAAIPARSSINAAAAAHPPGGPPAAADRELFKEPFRRPGID